MLFTAASDSGSDVLVTSSGDRKFNWPFFRSRAVTADIANVVFLRSLVASIDCVGVDRKWTTAGNMDMTSRSVTIFLQCDSAENVTLYYAVIKPFDILR